MPHFPPRTTTTALIDGKEVLYDMTSRKRYGNIEGFSYIGKGKIHKIDGKVQTYEKDYYFWTYQ